MRRFYPLLFTLFSLLSYSVSSQSFTPSSCGGSYTTTGTDINVYDSQCTNESATISSIFDTNGEEAAVFFFNISNGSATGETFPSIVFNNGNTNVDWSVLIAEAELVNEDGDAVTTSGANITATTITFTGFAAASLGDFGFLEGNGSGDASSDATNGVKPNGLEYALFVYFNTNTNIPDLDGEFLVFGLDNTSFPGSTGFSGSGGNGGSASSGATNNEVEVIATQLDFISLDAAAQPNTNFNAEVQAEDVNGTRDTDVALDATSVTITTATGAGTVAGTDNVSLSSNLLEEFFFVHI